MSITKKLVGALAAAAIAVLVTGCQIDTTTPMMVSQIRAVADTGAPSSVMARVTAVFATKDWCQDEGVMAAEVLAKINLLIQPLGCSKSQPSNGQFHIPITVVRTEGGSDPTALVAQTLGSGAAKFAVFAHGKRKDLISVGLFINIATLQNSKETLVQMPVYKQGLYNGEVGYSFTIPITNDTATPATFVLSDVEAGGDAPADEAVLTIPPGGSDMITLDSDKQAKLAQLGWVNFFALKVK